MNWKLFLEALGSAAINGAAGGATQAIATGGGHVNTGTAISAGIGALFGILTYLKQPAFAPPPAPAPPTATK